MASSYLIFSCYCLLAVCITCCFCDEPLFPFMLRTGIQSSRIARMDGRQTGCDGTPQEMRQSMGMIKSPQRPGLVQCAWLIRAPAGKVVDLLVKELSLPSSPHCTEGALTVYAGDSDASAPVARLCGDISHQRVLADTADVFITYESATDDDAFNALWFFRSV